MYSPYFRFRAKDGKFVKLEAKWKQFRNPWTKEIEYLICKNNLLIEADEKSVEGAGSFKVCNDMNFFEKNNFSENSGSSNNVAMGKDIQRVISSHAEAAMIGRRIAEEARDKSRYDSSASNSPLSIQQPSPRSFVQMRNPSDSTEGEPSFLHYCLTLCIVETFPFYRHGETYIRKSTFS